MRIALPFPRRHGSMPDAPQVSRRKRPAALRIALALAGMAVLLAIGLVIWRARVAAAPAPTAIVPITVGDLTVQVESSGTIRPVRTVDLPFQVSGQVEQVLVK